MKNSEYYKNNFPLEPLLKIDFNNDFNKIQDIVNNCDYTVDADKVSSKDNLPLVNTYDATIFYIMGYEAAINRISECLIPIEI